MSATAGLTLAGSGSTGSRSDGSALATCTSGDSATGTGDESVGAASTNNFGWSGTVVVSAATAVSGSVAGATSASTALTLLISAGCGASARWASAVSNAARW